MQEILIFMLVITQLVTGFLLIRSKSRPINLLETQNYLNQLSTHIESIKSSNNKLPEVILNSLTGSVNTHKGKVGELIGYLSIKAKYDRLIPLNSISDFMGIKFPEEGKEGTVDFIDIKTGSNSRLNKDQRQLKQLIIEKKIKFKTLKIDELDGIDESGDSNDK